MFRTSNHSSSGGVLYKQLGVFQHASSLVADTIRMILEYLRLLKIITKCVHLVLTYMYHDARYRESKNEISHKCETQTCCK